MTPTEIWPLFGLVIRTPRLELRLPTDVELARLAQVAAYIPVTTSVASDSARPRCSRLESGRTGLSTRTHAPRSPIREAGDMKLLVRLAVILGGSLLYSIVMTNLFPTEDADIGAGLIYFALLLTVSGIWGLWDGFHAKALPPVFVRWALIAGVVGLSGPFRIWFEEGRDFAVLWSDLLNLTPFLAGLVLAPAAVGIAIGSALGSGARIPAKGTSRNPSL